MSINSVLFTIGHSTRPREDLIEILQANRITMLVDVRRYPSSRTNPQYNSDSLADDLPQHGIRYVWLEKLGGRREGLGRQSKNNCLKNRSFRNYADYMETPAFLDGFNQLTELIHEGIVSIMCAEALYWRCHRSLISDFAKSKGLQVVHLVGRGRSSEHKYTQCAKVVNGTLTYRINSKISDFSMR